MLRTIRKYQKSVFGILAICFIVLAMSGFGVDMFMGRKQKRAITVNERGMEYVEFYRDRKNIQRAYFEMFKGKVPELPKEFYQQLNQDLVDKTISDFLLEEEARAKGLTVAPSELQEIIRTQLFNGNFNHELYAGYLTQQDYTAQAFESKLASDASRNKIEGLISDFSRASKRESQALYLRENTKFNVDYLEIAPEKFKAAVANPSDQEIDEYFAKHAADYELPAALAYNYVVFDPKKFEQLVEVAPEDIEFFYTENGDRFTVPDEAKVLIFSYPAPADQAKLEEVRSKLLEIRNAALNGESLDLLRLRNAEIAGSKAEIKDYGWVKRGKLPKSFESEVFKVKSGLTEVISADGSIGFAKIDGFKDTVVKKLDEVKAEIEAEIRRRDAPAYAATKAQDVLDKFRKGNGTLADAVKDFGLAVAATSSPLTSETDPTPELKGLTAKLMVFAQDKRQLVDLGEKGVLVEITEYKEANIPGLERVKDQVIGALKDFGSKKLAREAADRLLASLAKSEHKSLEEAAKAQKLSIQKQENISPISGASGIFSRQEIKDAVFGSVELEKPTRYFEQDGKFYIIQVTKVLKPDLKDFEGKQKQYLERESQQLASNFVTSLVNRGKAKATIEVDQSLYSIE